MEGKKNQATPADHAPSSHCENCIEPRSGRFCHQCGQALVGSNPRARYGRTGVLEAYWQIYDRVARTLYDLLWPGRVAIQYLAGHRVRYVAPLRLFSLLSVLAFLIAQYMVSTGEKEAALTIGPVEIRISADAGRGSRTDAIAKAGQVALTPAKTLADVERLRDAQLQLLQQQLEALPDTAIAQRNQLFGAIRDINRRAGCRAAQLHVDHATATERVGKRKPAEDARNYGTIDCDDYGLRWSGDRPWDLEANPVVIAWAPAFLNRWINQKIDRHEYDLARLDNDPSFQIRAVIKAVPPALFMLVPVFALILALAHIGSGRHYLEHLVIAIYSHVFLCMALLVMFVMTGLDKAITPHWAGFQWISGGLVGLLWLWMPVYLLLMQKRVYGRRWLPTLMRFAVIGSLYFFLLAFATNVLAIIGVLQM